MYVQEDIGNQSGQTMSFGSHLSPPTFTKVGGIEPTRALISLALSGVPHPAARSEASPSRANSARTNIITVANCQT